MRREKRLWKKGAGKEEGKRDKGSRGKTAWWKEGGSKKGLLEK